MSSGLYDMSAKDFDKTLDLTMLKPYGDTMNDGKVQVSFTLPVKNDDRGMEAARLLSRQMGLSEPNVAYARALDKEFTFYVVYGSCTHSVDYTKIRIHAIEDKAMEMDEVDDYIREHIGEKIYREDIAESTGFHKDSLTRIFRTETGFGLKEFITKEKIEHAKRLLKTTNKSISEIAMDLGFDNFSHFSQAFKKEAGMSPFEYRKKHS